MAQGTTTNNLNTLQGGWTTNGFNIYSETMLDFKVGCGGTEIPQTRKC
jgi:hypothetical protein